MYSRKKTQENLKKLGFYKGVIDGVFGSKTKRAIKKFQRKHGLVIDGVAGSQTQQALKIAIDKPKDFQKEPDKSAIFNKAISIKNSHAKGRFKKVKLEYTKRPINQIIVHCTATPSNKNFYVNDINAWHKARGWIGIGYHYLILLDGTIQIGRPVGQVGAHTRYKNKRSIGIAYVGGLTFDGKIASDTRTSNQKAALEWLVGNLADQYAVKRISGHNEHSSKACPCFNVKKDFLGNLTGFKSGLRV